MNHLLISLNSPLKLSWLFHSEFSEITKFKFTVWITIDSISILIPKLLLNLKHNNNTLAKPKLLDILWGGGGGEGENYLLLHIYFCYFIVYEWVRRDYAIMKKYNLTAPLFNEELQNTKSCLVLIFIFIAYERNLLQFYIQMHWQTEDDMFLADQL